MEERAERRRAAARATNLIGLAVLASRVLGLGREIVFARIFGAGLFDDAWRVAFRVPNLLRDLFAEGAFSSAFVPTFTSELQGRGREAAFRLANIVFSLLLILVGCLSLALMAFSSQIIWLLAPGFAAVATKAEITAALVQILSPFLLLVSLAAVAMGMLNTLNYFFLPALAPALFNLSLIVCGLFLSAPLERVGIEPIYALAGGALVGGLLQFLVQTPILWQEGFRFRFQVDLWHSGVQRTLRLLGPALVGIGAIQINLLVNTWMASILADNGPVSWLEYGFRIFYLPLGLFGVSVGVVHLREVSWQAAEKRWSELKETVADSLTRVSLLAMPSTVGLLVLALPLVRVLYERGAFSVEDSQATSLALICYSLGLCSYSYVKILVPTFYALEDTRTPVRISISAVATNLACNLILVFWLLPTLAPGHEFAGLALGTTVAASVNALQLTRAFRLRAGPFMGRNQIFGLLKMMVASLLMGVGVFQLGQWIEVEQGAIGSLLVSICFGVLLYGLLCRILGIQEMSDLLKTVFRRQSSPSRL